MVPVDWWFSGWGGGSFACEFMTLFPRMGYVEISGDRVIGGASGLV
jgi:hypothetical protein